MEITGKTAAEIFDGIRQMIQTRQLRSGQTLPPVRTLATRLGINRNTAAAAYQRLVHAGLATTHRRLGTRIRYPHSPLAQEGALAGTPLTDLASGNPNPVWLPNPFNSGMAEAYQPVLYGENIVHHTLEDLAREWIDTDCPQPFCIDVASGTIDAVERLLTAWLAPGDQVAVENPCFLSSINMLRNDTLRVTDIAVDSEGPQPQALQAALTQGARAVLLTARAHNPTGCSLSRVRAAALRRVLRQYPDTLVIIDDHFALLAGSDYYSIISPATRHWALIRSVSKGLGPDLRLALIAADPETSRRLRLRLTAGANWVSHVLQRMVSACLRSGNVRRQLRQARQDYARRRNRFAEALREQGIPVSLPADGLNLWLPLAEDSDAVVLRLAQRGWLVRSGTLFSVLTPVQGLRITIATLDQSQTLHLAKDIRLSLSAS